MRTTDCYVFREITAQGELECFLKLRYASYYDSPRRGFLTPHERGIDINIYDLHARHFGLFCDRAPCGYFRVVHHKVAYYNPTAYAVGLQYAVFRERTHTRPSITKSSYADFPFVSYLNVPGSVKNYYRHIVNRGEEVVEPGRFVLARSYGGLRKAMHLIECALVLYHAAYVGKKHAVVNCDGNHERVYRSYGFQTINRTESYYLKGRRSVPSALLSLSASWSLPTSPIPARYHRKISEMAEEYTATQQIMREL